MALVKGTNCGFVTTAPTSDPLGANTINMDNRAWAFKDTAPAGATTITEIGWWCDNATEAADWDGGIYDHNVGDNNPEAKVGDFSVNNAKGTGLGWKNVTGLNISITAGTIYWIATQLDNTSTSTKGDYTSTGGEKSDYKDIQSALVDPWGTNTGTLGILISIYAVYTTGAAPASSIMMMGANF